MLRRILTVVVTDDKYIHIYEVHAFLPLASSSLVEFFDRMERMVGWMDDDVLFISFF